MGPSESSEDALGIPKNPEKAGHFLFYRNSIAIKKCRKPCKLGSLQNFGPHGWPKIFR